MLSERETGAERDSGGLPCFLAPTHVLGKHPLWTQPEEGGQAWDPLGLSEPKT